MKTVTERKPFLLVNSINKADEYIRKVKEFGREVEKFKPVFDAIVTKNLNVTFNKSWLKSILEDGLKDRVNGVLISYLESQPTMLHNTIFKEFEVIEQGLYRPANILKSTFDRAINQSASTSSPYPNGLGNFQSFPIDETGTLIVTDEWETNIKKQFETWLTTDQDFQRLDALQACIDAQDKFKEVYGEAAPYVWQAFNGNGFVTGNRITGEHLKALIKW